MNKLENKVRYLKQLSLFRKKDDQADLLFLNVEGISEDTLPGLPKLVAVGDNPETAENGILEFDFIVEPVNFVERKQVTCSLNVVFDYKALTEKIIGIKVNAVDNADIALIHY